MAKKKGTKGIERGLRGRKGPRGHRCLPKTASRKQEAENCTLEAENCKQEAASCRQEAENGTLEAASRKQEAASRKQEAENCKLETASRKQEAENCKLHPSPVSPRSPASPTSPLSPSSPSPHNPDVLTCLANLSNDEVFTPPQMANNLLDLLPVKIWGDKNTTFLDPCCKSGVFLREIVKRLNEGLKAEIPDLQKRINHILTRQVFGLAITEMTGLLSRRSVYCSKAANEKKYSLCTAFEDDQGNIRFNPKKHTWSDGRCVYCGASEAAYQRDDGLESHAYAFIHTENPEELFKMKFDVIVGNPPYQLSDGGAQASAIPLYHRFVQQAKKLNPRYLTMIIPSRWFAGGKGLDEFRDEMLNDKRVPKIVDYFDSTECFPNVDISGGVCYFLWDRDNKGECEIKSIRAGQESSMMRPLLEKGSDTFVRFNEAISIVRKIEKLKEAPFDVLVSSRKPFGVPTNVEVKNKQSADDIKIYAYPKNGYVAKGDILKGQEWIDKHKVLIAYSYGERGSFPYLILGKPFFGEKGSCCSETYLVIGPFTTKKETDNVMSYIRTKFFRFLILLKKNTQHATRQVYSFVPMQDFSEEWTDEKLYKKYGLAKEEIEFIESMIRPMGLGDLGDGGDLGDEGV